MNYAAGLFIWADMVVTYVGHRGVGGSPAKRLADVINDIKSDVLSNPSAPKELDGRGRVDCVYARIVFEAFRHSTPGEQEMAKSILAAVVLAIEPLRMRDLADLLSTDKSDSSDVLASVESTLRELGPIIPTSDDANDRLRVFHKTVSDFFSSHNRSLAAMRSVVKNSAPQTLDDPVPNPLSFVLDCVKENRSLALACVHLARRNLSLDIHSISGLLKQSNGPLDYAHQHWFEHLESGGGSRIPNFKCLANAMRLAYGCLQRYAPQMLSAEEETVALVEALRDAAAFASQCINGASNGNLFCSSKEGKWSSNMPYSFLQSIPLLTYSKNWKNT